MTDYAEALRAGFTYTAPILGVMGVEVVSAEPGRAVLRLPHQQSNGNHLGTVYAGVLFSFLEAAGRALTLVTLDVSRWLPVIVEAKIRYLKPVTGPIETELSLDDSERVALESQLIADPRARWTVTARATTDDGVVACEADLVYRFKAIG